MIDFKSVVSETTELTQLYRSKLDSPVELERIKELLTANKLLLGDLYLECVDLYRTAKRTLIEKKGRIYEANRAKGMSTQDAENDAKLTTIPYLLEVDKMLGKKEKSYQFLHDVQDIIIAIAVRLREAKNQITYG